MVIKIRGKTLLLIATGVGIGITAWLAAKNTPEAQKRKEDALAAKRERTGDPNAQLTFIESLQAQIGAYAPAIISGMVTMGSFVGSEVINENNMKKAEKAFDNYKSMTDKLSGKGASKFIDKAVEQKKADYKKGKPWEQKETFRIVFQGNSIQFESTRYEVMEAIYEANRYFHGRGILTFNEFLEYLGQPPVSEGNDRGWECYIGESIYGYTWIDFGMKDCPDEPWVTEIYMPCYPHFFDEDEANHEIEESYCGKLSSGESTSRFHKVPAFIKEAAEEKGLK